MTHGDDGTGAHTTAGDPAFDRFARLVHSSLDVPVALVSFVGPDEQVFPGAHGLPEPWSTLRATPLSHSFCKHVVAADAPLVIADARSVALVKDNLAIEELDVIAYAGFPIHGSTGEAVGSLCAIDHRPRAWTHDELDFLRDLAEACSSEVRLRDQEARSRSLERDADARATHWRLLLQVSEQLAAAGTVEDVLAAIDAFSTTAVGSRWSAVALPDEGRRRYRYTSWDHMPPLDEDRWRQADPAAPGRPLAEAIRRRSPLMFEDSATLTAQFPQLARDPEIARIGASAALPLLVGGEVVGVLTLIWEEPRDFDDETRSLLTALGGYAAVALERARLLAERRHVAHTLQAAMLTALPEVEGLRLAATYTPAAHHEQVGGDWYDALVLADGGLALMVGDVTGHDMRAASVMGQLRSLLRAYTWEHDEPPSVILALLDRADEGTGLRATGTVALVRLLPADGAGRRAVTWSSAGHPTPLVVRADGSVEHLPGSTDLMIGVVPTTVRQDHDAYLDPDETLVLYTDGLVERRGESLTVGIRRLGDALGRLARAPDLAEHLVDELAPPGDRQDDVVVLTVHVDS